MSQAARCGSGPFSIVRRLPAILATGRHLPAIRATIRRRPAIRATGRHLSAVTLAAGAGIQSEIVGWGIGMAGFKKKLVYVYDALCPWCYGFTGVVRSLQEYYGDHFDYEVLSGGMYRGDGVKTVGGVEEARRLREAYGRIEEMTGASFGERFFEFVAAGERRLDSELAAVALAAFRIVTSRGEAAIDESDPEDEGSGFESGRDQSGFGPSELDFAHAVLRAVFQRGGDPTKTGFYEDVAVELGLDPAALSAAMESNEARDGAAYDFALVRQLGADGFPRLYLQTAEDYLHLLAKGYAPFEQVHRIIETIESDS